MAVFLVVLVAQYAALSYALQRDHALMRDIVEENESSRRTIDALSDEIAALSYRIIGVSGGIYAAQSIAYKLPERGKRIIAGWTQVHQRLSDFSDEETKQQAAEAVARLPAFLEETRQLFEKTGPVPTPDELLLLERNHDEWLDYRTALIRFTEVVRERVAENSAKNFVELQEIQSKLSVWSATAFASGLVALGVTWYLLVFLIARPVTGLVASMRRIATGDTSTDVPNLGRANEVGDMARAVQVFKEKSIENQRLQAEESRRSGELAAARDEAQAANRAKSEFLANMSHELRTPLNAILGFSEMMKREILGPVSPPKYRDYVDDIHHMGSHLLSLVNDILEMSKVEAGESQLQESEFSVRETVEESIRTVTAAYRDRSSSVVLDRQSTLPRLFADRRMFTQMVLNLMSNAVKYTPESGRIRVNGVLAENGTFRLSVSDTGIGMSDQEINEAFEPFRRVDHALTSNFEGIGLGLPLTKAMIEMHGGKLEVASVSNRGTTATLVFPAERVRRPAEQRRERA